MISRNSILPLLFAAFIMLVWPGSPAQAGRSDQFIAGYATALVERDFPGSDIAIRVESGTVWIKAQELDCGASERLRVTLLAVPGVREVRTANLHPVAALARPAPQALSEPDILPSGTIFPALLADPRWPHFSASYQYYINKAAGVRHTGSATFGETFSLLRSRVMEEGEVELGIQAGVFSIFDMDTPSTDLINSDFRVAIPMTYRHGDNTALFRIFHQSSHLGDEYILRGIDEDERVNLSYESLHLLLAREFQQGIRLYGGGGYIFRKDPSDLDPWSLQTGLEFRSPSTLWRGKVRPLAAVDLQMAQESGWNVDVSARAGIQLENPDLIGRKLQLLLEYYNGHSPNGQFFDKSIHYLGLGVHVHLY
jgi:hypothetical protein